MRNQKGFTLIELVVVIVILGILAAVAVPKFVDMQEDAKKAAVQGAAAGLNSGVTMGHAKWLVAGSNDVTLDIATGVTLGFNAQGWPSGDGGGAVANADDCVQLWTKVMSTNSMEAAATGKDFNASVAGTATTCLYTYSGSTGSGYVINYDSLTGNVSVP